METIEHKDFSFTVWDVGGRDKKRPLWRHYYQNTQGIIFVVDSNDRDRIASDMDDSAKYNLHSLLKEDELRDAFILVYANKQDLPNALTVEEVAERLELNRIENRPWYIVPCCGPSGEGLYKGLVTYG